MPPAEAAASSLSGKSVRQPNRSTWRSSRWASAGPELNYISDVDVVFIAEPSSTRKSCVTPDAHRCADRQQQVMRTANAATSEGPSGRWMQRYAPKAKAGALVPHDRFQVAYYEAAEPGIPALQDPARRRPEPGTPRRCGVGFRPCGTSSIFRRRRRAMRPAGGAHSGKQAARRDQARPRRIAR